MKVDAHHHLWTILRGDYGWLTPALGPIYRDFTMDDISPLLDATGIDRTIVVKAADTVRETEFLLSQAEGTERVAGVVGWIDMQAPDAIATLDRLAEHPKFCGIRPMIQGISDDNWILHSQLDPVFDRLTQLGLTFDALVLPRHLRPLLTRLRRNPDLRCVIDHGAKPDLAGGNIADWRDDIAHLAAETTCLCKLSGLLTEAGDQPTLDRIRPAFDHLLASFGPERLMFGSDWPVLNLAADYASWVAMVEELLSGLPAEQAAKIWGETAMQFYTGLPR